MRLTAILLTLACISAGAKGITQGINLSEKNVPIQKVLEKIQGQTGYVFWYEDKLLENAKPVTIAIQNASLETTLQQLFKGQSIRYEIVNKTIVLKKEEKKDNANKDVILSEAVTQSVVEVDISGRVTNAQGEPLSGASIIIKRTGKGDIADANGNFSLKGLGNDDVITISYTGYKAKTITVGSKTIFAVVLELAVDDLDQVQIIGYGKTTRRLSTGDVDVITAKDIEKNPVMNPLLALQGRVAGLDIQQTSGYASAPIRATLRGLSSVDAKQVPDPLYIVDGVPLTVLNIGKTQNFNTGSYGFLQNSGLTGPANGQSPLFNLNPTDIESITVLKDADATSIYGSRGANGVVLITTKTGKAGKTNLDIHVEEGVNMVTRYWDMLNTQQYLEMRKEALKNDGLTPNASNFPEYFVWDTTRYTDWQRAIYGRKGKVITTQASLSGGNLQTNFRVSASYTHSTTVTTVNGADQRASMSLNLNHRSANQRFGLSFSNTYSLTKSDMISLPGRISYAPNAPAIFDSLGGLNWKDWNVATGSTGSNPFSSLLQPYNAQTSFLNSNLILNLKPLRGLEFTTSFGYNIAQVNQSFLTTIASQDPARNPTGTAQFGNNRNSNWIIEPQISYSYHLGSGELNVLFGGSMQRTVTDGIFIKGTNYNSDALLHTISNAPNQSSSDNYGEYRYAALFTRIGYDISHKYLINLNARRDGSSNYGPGNEFGNFGSIGTAWIFTEERWIKKNLHFLSFGKIQGSYGTSGSDGGLPYGYITRWSSKGLFSYNGTQPLIPTQHANPDYHWQLNRKLEASISLGFFKDWLTIRTAYYRSRTNNQLLSYPTPMLSGFSSVIANLQALVQNRGWEFTIGGRGVHTKYFSWAPNFNLAINQNKFVSFPGLGSSPYRNSGLIGKPLNGSYVLHYIGVDPQTGQYTYEDKNHDGTITSSYIIPNGGDLYFKQLSPTLSTGFGFNFDVKSFDLSIFFTAKRQTGINALNQGLYPGLLGYNQPIGVLDRWQKPGDITNVGKFSTRSAQDPNGNLYSSDIGYTDASYVRLSNLSLNYNVGEHYLKKIGIKTFKFYINANNIFTITDYKGIDPETQNFGSMPPTRTIVGGISVNF